MPTHPIRSLPDVASAAQTDAAGALDWVGMENIALPVRLLGADGATVQSAARVSAFVNLANAQLRGIHMSRLYLHLDRALGAEALTPAALRRLLHEFLDSHSGLSDRAMVRIAFEHLLRRSALVSDNSGWKAYPVEVTATLAQGHFTLELQADVQYSSTCPASAALARQVVQNRFVADFARGKALDHVAVECWLGTQQGICATPHSQRSTARVRVRLAPGFDLPVVELLDAIETALATPVQTAVKREDEQAFARLNGENPMFCEDAARRIRRALDADERIADFHIRAAHHESLHAHDAVAVATKNVPGGY
ncbi:MAG: GTP cyclohydrolase I FolE2 [Xanthomonadales bacterium PRO7]|jgi:GTP cyclohydrolase I|nr:GTP cyclohydrolase I FolE2 [Xanthomonadales bacterium PRO7]HMM58187.1 GTP cyclohydrolase FolE2 [Rudaea sp.]